MGKFRTSAIWILILFITIAILSGPASAQNDKPGQPLDPSALPFAGDTGESFTTPDHMLAVGDWSLLAYQKLYDNWDIVVHDKSGLRRLTTGDSADQQPSLNRGAQRIAFVSDRDGDPDLYSMNVDGSDLYKILDTKFSLGFPSWSPDGQRIALQASVGSQHEIFTINADGSDPQRLTNNPAFDGMPTWSPDGKRLAFSSNRSGDYGIYVINADGSGLRRLSSYPLSLHPTWSPDGLSIAFDADIDGDGWQELALIEAGGARQRMVYNPAGDVTAWAGSWSPDNQSLGFTEITAELRNGFWVWTRGVVRKWSPTSGAVNLVPGGREWYIDWQTKDAIPPQTTIDPLPAYSRAEDFVLRWSGVDYGGSGVKSYAVYYNIHDGSGWHTLQGQTTNTHAFYPASPGTTVDFMVRGTDNAFNRGDWRLQNTAATSFFNTLLTGTINDNRGTALSGVHVNVSPALPFDPPISSWQGRYTGYTAKDQNHTLTIDEPAYMPVPGTTAPAGADFQRDIYLRPQDNRIGNGTFEQSASEPAQWLTGGSLPVAITAENPATGKYALRLGYAQAAQAKDSVQIGSVASISQQVRVPSSMLAPTLSYMVRAADGSPGSSANLRVLIQATTQALPITTNKVTSADWRLNWIDMTPWLGQDVLITFELRQAVGDPPPLIYLDDISLGSAHPDLWVELAAESTAALPGDIVPIKLDYSNHGPIAAEDVIVELALPAELSLVSATEPYTIKNNVLRWDTGNLAARGAANRLSIEVTPSSNVAQTVTAKALIFAGTTEAHLRNNVSETSVNIGKKIYMPLLR